MFQSSTFFFFFLDDSWPRCQGDQPWPAVPAAGAKFRRRDARFIGARARVEEEEVESSKSTKKISKKKPYRFQSNASL